MGGGRVVGVTSSACFQLPSIQGPHAKQLLPYYKTSVLVSSRRRDRLQFTQIVGFFPAAHVFNKEIGKD